MFITFYFFSCVNYMYIIPIYSFCLLLHPFCGFMNHDIHVWTFACSVTCKLIEQFTPVLALCGPFWCWCAVKLWYHSLSHVNDKRSLHFSASAVNPCVFFSGVLGFVREYVSGISAVITSLWRQMCLSRISLCILRMQLWLLCCRYLCTAYLWQQFSIKAHQRAFSTFW